MHLKIFIYFKIWINTENIVIYTVVDVTENKLRDRLLSTMVVIIDSN